MFVTPHHPPPCPEPLWFNTKLCFPRAHLYSPRSSQDPSIPTDVILPVQPFPVTSSVTGSLVLLQSIFFESGNPLPFMHMVNSAFLGREFVPVGRIMPILQIRTINTKAVPFTQIQDSWTWVKAPRPLLPKANWWNPKSVRMSPFSWNRSRKIIGIEVSTAFQSQLHYSLTGWPCPHQLNLSLHLLKGR